MEKTIFPGSTQQLLAPSDQHFLMNYKPTANAKKDEVWNKLK